MSQPNRFAAIAGRAKQENGARDPSDSPGRSTSTGRLKTGPRPPELKDAPKSRDGMKGITVFVQPEMRRALNSLKADEETTTNALVIEAINLLLRARGKHPIGA